MGPWSVPSKATVFANGIKQVEGKCSLNEKGGAKAYKTFDGPLIARTIADYTFTLESPVFKADGLSVADATAEALGAEVLFNVTINESGQVFNFWGVRDGSDVQFDPDNPATHSRTYIITRPMSV